MAATQSPTQVSSPPEQKFTPLVAKASSFFSSTFSTMATKLKTVVEEEKKAVKGFLSDNNNSENTKAKLSSEAFPPWENLPTNDPKLTEEVKNQILNLPKAKRNFLNAPPDDANFQFDLNDYLPVAQVALKADPQLSNARFYLVPKYIKEPPFWRNYFYRVWIIKEAYGLNPKVENPKNEKTNTTPNTNPSPASNNPSQQTQQKQQLRPPHEDEDTENIKDKLKKAVAPSPHLNVEGGGVLDDHELEFVSDGFDVNNSSDDFDIDEISKELGQLGVVTTNGGKETSNTDTASLSSSSTANNAPANVEIDESWEEQMRKELEEDINSGS